MKKFLFGLMVSLIALSLAACAAEYAEGVDSQFGSKAISSFEEIDDDTMEVGFKELSDADDIGNFDLLSVEADHERELAFVDHMEQMIALQGKVQDGDKEALKAYLKERKAALNALGIKDDGYTVPQFGFYEED
jgi:hypothetical protein